MESTLNDVCNNEFIYLNGKKHGIKKKKDLSGFKIVSYNNGVKHGMVYDCFHYGNLYAKYSYRNGKLNGKYECFWYNGELEYQDNYKNGKKHGISYKWYSNGQLADMYTYKNGNLDGLYKIWHKDDGELMSYGFYVDNRKFIGLHSKY